MGVRVCVSYFVHGKTPNSCTISVSSVTSFVRCVLPRHCHSLRDRGEISHFSVTQVLICSMRTLMLVAHLSCGHSAAEADVWEGGEQRFEIEREELTEQGRGRARM